MTNRSTYREEYSAIVAAYHEFLRTASEWLSRRATDVCIIFEMVYVLDVNIFTCTYEI